MSTHVEVIERVAADLDACKARCERLRQVAVAADRLADDYDQFKLLSEALDQLQDGDLEPPPDATIAP